MAAMFSIGPLAVLLVAALCSATLGSKMGAIVMAALPDPGTVIAFSSIGEALILVLACGGGFLLVAVGAGLGLGSTSYKKK